MAKKQTPPDVMMSGPIEANPPGTPIEAPAAMRPDSPAAPTPITVDPGSYADLVGEKDAALACIRRLRDGWVTKRNALGFLHWVRGGEWQMVTDAEGRMLYEADW